VNNTIYKAPDWLYRPANVMTTMLGDIQKELTTLSFMIIKDKFNSPSEFHIIMNLDLIKEVCPTLMIELKRLGISDIVAFIALITVRSGSKFPIHIDYPDQRRQSFGLNIPVLNCKDSYTVWYDAEPMPHKTIDQHIITSELVSASIPCDEETAIEIDRCDANVSHWINNNVPHKPICLHDNFRINASVRFTSDIYELIASGYFDKHLVKHE